MKTTVPPAGFPHIMVTASAGSGKTWQLTNRILGLILAGARPESIIALTFTRKAAGEFFDAVLGRLAEAASDPSAAAQLCRDLEIEARPPAAFLPPLRALISQLHRLQFTTIDSFFHRIVSSFPFELGLSGAFSLMDGYQAGQAPRAGAGTNPPAEHGWAGRDGAEAVPAELQAGHLWHRGQVPGGRP